MTRKIFMVLSVGLFVLAMQVMVLADSYGSKGMEMEENDYVRSPDIGPISKHGGRTCDPPGTKCGNANTSDAHYYRQCGASLSADKCFDCGADLPAGTKFCSQCGKPQQELSTSPADIKWFQGPIV